MTAAFLPFNQNPDSVAIKTSSYTIPAGFYARVIATNFETDFTIDSVVAVEKIKYKSTTPGVSTAAIFTNTSAYTLMGSCTTNLANSGCYVNNPSSIGNAVGRYVRNPYGTNYPLGVSTSQIGNNFTGASSTYNQAPIYLSQDNIIYGSGVFTVRYLDFVAIDPPTMAEFWVPTGTDLDGTRFTVELYAIP